MDFHGEDVDAVGEERGIDGEGGHRHAVISGIQREGRGRHDAGRHVEAAQLNAVEVNDRTVIAFDVQVDAGEAGGVADDERPAEIRGDVFGSIAGTKDVGGGRWTSVGIPITQRRRTAGPSAVVEVRRDPRRALVRIVIKIFPDGTIGHERPRHADVHRLRGEARARVRASDRRESMRAAGEVRPHPAERGKVALGELHAIHEKLDGGDRTCREIAPRRDRDSGAVQIHRVLERREQSDADVLHEHVGRRRFHRAAEAVNGRDVDGVGTSRDVFSQRAERRSVVRGKEDRGRERAAAVVKLHLRRRRIREIRGEGDGNWDRLADRKNHSVRHGDVESAHALDVELDVARGRSAEASPRTETIHHDPIGRAGDSIERDLAPLVALEVVIARHDGQPVLDFARPDT